MKKISFLTSFVWITTWLESLRLCLVLPAQMWTSLHCVFLISPWMMQDHPCVNLCCPHGHCSCWGSRKSGDGTETLNTPFSTEFWTEHDMQMEDYGKEQGFILKAPKSKEKRFGCSNPHELYLDPLHYYTDFSASSYTVTADGRLHGKRIE